MAKGKQTPDLKDEPYDPLFHEPGTKGHANGCTVRGCVEPPVVSRHWLDPDPKGWWASYCQEHADEKAKRV